MRVLSIDPAVRNTGYAVVEQAVDARRRATFRAVTYGTIKASRTATQSQCLAQIHDDLREIIREHQPEVCAVEGIIYVQSHRTAISMGAARGAAILTAACEGLSVWEYAPKRVKQAVTGKGAADKQQVAFMVRALLNLTETPDPDAADALAIGLTHFYAHDPTRPSFGKDARAI